MNKFSTRCHLDCTFFALIFLNYNLLQQSVYFDDFHNFVNNVYQFTGDIMRAKLFEFAIFFILFISIAIIWFCKDISGLDLHMILTYCCHSWRSFISKCLNFRCKFSYFLKNASLYASSAFLPPSFCNFCFRKSIENIYYFNQQHDDSHRQYSKSHVLCALSNICSFICCLFYSFSPHLAFASLSLSILS